MTPPKIISFGEVLWDLFPGGAEFGGAPANFACHAAGLGAQVDMVSAVGDDSQGREALTILNRHGIRTRFVQTVHDAPTGSVGIEIDSEGKPTFTIHNSSAWDCLDWSPALGEAIGKADAVYFGTLGQRSKLSRSTIQRALAVAEQCGIPRVLDINLRAPFFDSLLIRKSLERASILKLSDEELDQVCQAGAIFNDGSTIDRLRGILNHFTLDLVVLTRGADGALLINSEDAIDQPGVPTTVVDTVGAGDSFTAALVSGILSGKSSEDVLRQATSLAAKVCSQAGAVFDPPTFDPVDA